MSRYVDGEQEQLELLTPVLREASRKLAADMRQPLRPLSTECLRWLAREAFRLGFQHAHSRETVKVPNEEST